MVPLMWFKERNKVGLLSSWRPTRRILWLKEFRRMKAGQRKEWCKCSVKLNEVVEYVKLKRGFADWKGQYKGLTMRQKSQPYILTNQLTFQRAGVQ